MQLLKVVLVTGAVLTLSGCTILDNMKNFFNGKDDEKTVVAPAPEPVAEKPATKPKPARRRNHRKNNKPAVPTGTKDDAAASGLIVAESTETAAPVSEPDSNAVTITPNNNQAAPRDVSSCKYSANSINNTMESLARLALRSCQPKQPNMTLIRNISVSGTSCGSAPTTAVSSTLASSGKFSIVNSNLAKRIESQLHNASNGYMIRVAKSQNINYVVSGNVNTTKGVATLKIIDVSTGSVLWQHTAGIK